MTPVFTPGLTQAHYGVGKRRPYQFRQTERVMAQDAARSTTAVVASGGPSTPLVPFATHSSELLHYAPSFCKWTTCSLPAKHDLVLKGCQRDGPPVALGKRTLDDQGLQWQCKCSGRGGCALYEALQQLSLRKAYVVYCELNLLLPCRWLLSNAFVASMSGITLGSRSADRPPLSPHSVSSAVAWTPASTIGFGRSTASSQGGSVPLQHPSGHALHTRPDQALPVLGRVVRQHER
ncbi:hypothetical protein HPB50_014871 [Hyalomma asiaticum]|uniref:Uncharacterized protein n=1 Tax=Hyalomma asiaticum TaxID=266040 RepID=A0ACB7TIX9_HYAAI|nr:hypothetical protein HPB50_014871 [Hyalomma asiaticum]